MSILAGALSRLFSDDGNRNAIMARKFAHRYPVKGQIESICMNCLLTVCRCRTEKEMGEKEATHVCQNGPNLASLQFL